MTALLLAGALVVGVAIGFLAGAHHSARFYAQVAVGVAQKVRASVPEPEPAAALVEPPHVPAAPPAEPEHPMGTLDTRWTLWDQDAEGNPYPVMGLAGDTSEERERIKNHPGPKYDRVQRSWR